MKPMKWCHVPGLAVFILLFAVSARAEDCDEEEPFEADQAYIKEHYTKYEYQIAMRDGVKLFTVVFAPKDNSKPYPILLKRTPYGLRPYGASNYPQEPRGTLKYYADEPFIFAIQDVRGRNASEGEFVHVRPHKARKGKDEIDESTDTFDTIDWLVKNVPHNNRNVGLSGISYPGFYAAAGMIDAHPSLKCVSPQAPVTDWFLGDDFRHNGALYLAHAFRFFTLFGQPLEKPTRQSPVPFDYETPDGYEFFLNLGPLSRVQETYFPGDKQLVFWNELMEHNTYDEFWKRRTILPHLKNIQPAVMTVGGWFDAEDLYGPLNVYQFTEAQSPGAYNLLVMGPWAHGGWHRGDGAHLGHVPFHQKTAQFFRDKIERPFLQHFLEGADDPQLPEAYVFETGTNRWQKYDTWPPRTVSVQSLYFHPKGQLRSDPPPSEGEDSFDEYVSDPAKPVPFIPNIAIGMTREHMLDDQRFAASRTDVLVYTTEPLNEDLTIAGPIRSHLYVSTTGTDSDWVVKLIDVYAGDFPNPDPNPAGVQMGGFQQLVRGEVFRGKFRHSFETPEPFVSGKMTQIEYAMPDAYHTFRRGHRIMVQVQSSWFPLVSRNPQKFMNIYQADGDDYQKATQRVYRSGKAPSQVKLHVLTD